MQFIQGHGSGGKFSVEQLYENKVMQNHHGGAIKIGDTFMALGWPGWTCQDFKTAK